MYEYKVKQVTNVVDGDTIDVDIDLGFDVTISQRVRLAGIDTPEIHTTNVEEKKLGLEAKEYLKTRVLGRTDIVINTEKPDSTEKYGRMLGTLFIGNTSINQELLDKGYAWEYNGGVRTKDLSILKLKRGINV